MVFSFTLFYKLNSVIKASIIKVIGAFFYSKAILFALK